MKQKITFLQTEISRAAVSAEKWMLQHLSEENLLNRNISDPVKYYKWPLALISRGKNKEAEKIIEWINRQCLTEKGDYHSGRSGFHREFHHYANLWIILAAIRLGYSELVNKVLGCILQFHNKKTGGLATFPSDSDNITEDPVSTAFLGWTACEERNRDLADSILRFFERLADQEIKDNNFWLRSKTDGTFVKNIPAGADPKTYMIRLGEKEQCYYFLGAACYFFARYMETFDDTPLPLAHKYAGLLEKAGNKVLKTIWAAKVAPGCVALYSSTDDERFFTFALPVIRAVLNGQHPEGYWVKNGKPWITLTPEQCYWLSDISGRLR